MSKGAIPEGVAHDWSVFNFLAPWVDGHVKCGKVTKKLLGAAARWRMRTGYFSMPYEHKAYHRLRQVMNKLGVPRIGAPVGN